MDEDDLKGLSEAERAALAGDEDEVDSLEDVLDEAGGDDDDKEGGDDPGKDGEQGGAGDATGKGAAPAATDAEDEDEPFQPVYQAAPVEDYDEKMKALGERRAELRQRFNDGEISIDEYDSGLAEIGEERSTLESAKLKADIAQEQAQQTAAQRWQWEISRFMRQAAASGIEYRVHVAQKALEDAKASGDKEKIAAAQDGLRSTRVLNAALDTAVKDLAADPEYKGRPDVWFLEEAHRIVSRQFGRTTKAPAAGDAKKPVTSRRPDLSVVPKSLGGIAAAGADDTSTGDDEFAHLDNLAGMELEKAIAGMSKAQQERWARAS